MVVAGKLISLILEFGTHKKFIMLENNLRLDFFSPFMGILNTTIAEGAVPVPNYLESNNFRSKTLKNHFGYTSARMILNEEHTFYIFNMA